MMNGQGITIVLRASHLARLKTIQEQLLTQLNGRDEKNYNYIEKISLESLATICFTLGLSSKSLIKELERTISLHVLFSDIQNR